MHSIVIPHRDRVDHLRLCLEFILQSAVATGCLDFEVVLVDAGMDVPYRLCQGNRLRLVDLPREPVFNKNRCLNAGIDAAQGDLLTFLDCDMLVGPRFLDAAPSFLDDPSLTRLCYRSGQIPVGTSHLAGVRDEAVIDWCHRVFAEGRYDGLDFRSEFRGAPDNAAWEGEPVFGNGQYSIRRDVLGDLRFDEEYAGAGYEDLDMIRAIWWRYGDQYRGVMPSDPQMNLLHLKHKQDCPHWRTRELNRANKARYDAKAQQREVVNA